MNEIRDYYDEREQLLANELEDVRQLAEDRQDLIDEARAERAELLAEIERLRGMPKRLDQLALSLLVLLSMGALGFLVGGAIAMWRAFR